MGWLRKNEKGCCAMGLKIDPKILESCGEGGDFVSNVVGEMVKTTLEDRIVMIEGMIRANGMKPEEWCLVGQWDGRRHITRFERLDRMKDAGGGI